MSSLRERVRSFSDNYFSSVAPILGGDAMTVAPKLMLAKLLTNLKPLKPDERQLIEKAAAREGTEAPETIRIFIDEDIEILVRNWDPNRLLADRWPEEITDLTEYFMSLNGVPCEIDGR